MICILELMEWRKELTISVDSKVGIKFLFDKTRLALHEVS